MSIFRNIAVCAGVFLFQAAGHAATILQPISATSSVGSFNTYGPQYTINQSGLSGTYTSGVTDLGTFAAATTTVSGGSSFNGWYAPANVTTGNVDFNLGGAYAVEAFVIWNDHQVSTGQGVNSFNLWADDNAAFSSPTPLGSFTAIMTAEPNNFGQVFTFGPTSAAYVRLEILTNHGAAFTTGFSEAAFGISAVPIPGAIWLLGSGLVGLVGLGRRKTQAV